ncbi:Single-stranded DNA-binding protein why1, chloroplastic, variant 2 [Cymbomonas tetramitiformis]|uniref:Single-stranded DNA-binding protein why1, chloroplastic, variant 2 n=1 Tax=Cymbomonas tetramitiformis TaxID=36881 RepID=A0AAE0FRQ8_9CHLO|nr:Single-stranded DNA-binding protein why1, chloroplastic, variant 2 [Cymbomonas tetramitiformis]
MLEKPGCMLLEFAPAIGERQYDWSKKQTFSLSPVEAGDIMENAKEGCQFYHDPNKGRSGEGSITKQLSISRTPDGKGFFFQLGTSRFTIGAPTTYCKEAHATPGWRYTSIGSYSVTRVLSSIGTSGDGSELTEEDALVVGEDAALELEKREWGWCLSTL